MKKLFLQKWLLLLAFFFTILSNTFATNYVLSGAGSTGVNGTYIENGTNGGKPKYEFNNNGSIYVLGYSDMMMGWVIGEGGDWEMMSYYRCNSSANTPPSTGWVSDMMGQNPVPSVALDGKTLAYSAAVFAEHTDNDGSIANTIVITYNEYGGDALTGFVGDNFIIDNLVTISNVPAGLTASIIKTAANQLTFSLSGNANNHAQADKVDDITVIFQNSAFNQGDAAGVRNYSRSDIGIVYKITFSGGAGTPEAPYLISNKTDLRILSENWGTENLWTKHFKQTADISFNASDFQLGGDFYNSGEGWIPIGTGNLLFGGIYDGDSHTISGLFINRPQSNEQGLFSTIDGITAAQVKNLGVLNVNISGYLSIGGLAGGLVRGGIISNSYSSGIVTGTYYVGGLVGNNDFGSIVKSYSSVNVAGNAHSGGLVGYQYYGGISESYSSGNVTGTDYCGGLTGIAYYTSISNSYCTGNVTRSSGENQNVGGFVSNQFGGSITNSYSTGAVLYTGAANPTNKGFAGAVDGTGTITACYWDAQTSGQSTSTGSATGKITAEMKTQSTFTDAGWDFATLPIWHINTTDNNGYPHLAWQLFPPVAPTNQAYNIVFSNVLTSQVTLGWTNGNGTKRAVFVKEGSGAITNPADNTTYTASASWASMGSQLAASGYYCVYNDAGNSVSLTNLAVGTTYTVQVFEYAGAAGSEKYNAETATDNPNSQAIIACTNPTSGGTISANQTICSNYTPEAFTSSAAPGGHTGTLEYKWQKSATNATGGFSDISPAVTTETYAPGALTATTWYKRLSKVTCEAAWPAAGESNVLQITVNAPSFRATVRHVSDLTATGENIKWYAAASGGTALLSTDVLPNGTSNYYASQTVNSVESTARFHVVVTVDPTPCTPTGLAAQFFPEVATVASLQATGSNIRWYSAASGGEALAPSTVLADGTHYYATQTISCTESATRLDVTVAPLAIGSSYGGGLVAYILQSGDFGYSATVKHGLIAATVDQSTSSQFFTAWTAVATNILLGYGASNTTTIITTYGNTGSYAAKLCRDYRGGEYADWFLPSKNELNLLYLNIGNGATAPNTNIGNFSTSDSYWSSSQTDSKGGWKQHFNNGLLDSDYKQGFHYVRAIRSF